MVAPLLPAEIYRIEAQWMSFVKNKYLLLRSFPNVIAWNFLYLKSLKDQVHMRQITHFVRLLRKNSWNTKMVLAAQESFQKAKKTLYCLTLFILTD